MAYLFAMAVLLDSEGVVLNDELGGTLIASGVETNDGSSSRRPSTFFSFPDLTISNTGTFTIRIDIYQVDNDDPQGATMMEQVETRKIDAYEDPVAAQKPCKCCCPYFRAVLNPHGSIGGAFTYAQTSRPRSVSPIDSELESYIWSWK